MNKKILIDIGSSTVKAYLSTPKKLDQILVRSIPFKQDFDENSGISEKNKKELFELIHEIKEKNKDIDVCIYATALYRKLTPEARKKWADELFERTGLFFNIIGHDLENFYLQVALVGKYKSAKDPLLLINIGGGSTELVVMYGNEAIETTNIEIGVGSLLNEFEGLNKELSQVELKKLVSYIKENLPILKNKPKVAFYSGGELNYMQLASYKLTPNKLFKDPDHPSVITVDDFTAKNREVFSKIKLTDLENLMPDNPKWMHGARACSALAQAICEKYGIEKIIPSNSNLIDGVVRQEFRYVTISGSFRKHLDYILETRKQLIDNGIEVLSPRFTEPKNPGEEFVVFGGEEGMSPLELERHHLESIDKSDALVICDPDGYVGASALIEIGYANSLGKRIIFTEKPEEFMLNTLPAEIGL